MLLVFLGKRVYNDIKYLKIFEMEAESKGVRDMAGTARGSAAATGSETWYYMNGGKKQGPVDAAVLVSKLTAGELPPNTRVWKKGMEGWSPADETELLNRSADQKQTPTVISLNKAEQPETKRKKPWWPWLIVGILLAIMIGAACSVIVFRKKAAAAPAEPTAATEAVLSYGLKDPVIFENDQCAFLIDAVGEKGDYLELDVRCVNKLSDVISFSWNSTSVNGNMFDPLWKVSVQGNATMKSSITFPLSNLEKHNLLPGEEIKFVLSVFNEDQFEKLREESGQYITRNVSEVGKGYNGGCKEIKGYDGWYFAWRVKVDKNGRPYYVRSDKSTVYFDEIRDSNGAPLYKPDTTDAYIGSFYDDFAGRPYYFNKYGTTVYYDGCGYAFYDKETGRHYYYDENGKPAYYGNGGIPEYYEGAVEQELLDAGKPKALKRGDGSFIVHEEFVIYPTGKDAGKLTYPERISTDTEQIYWDGEKGTFVLLGGTMDAFKGYVVHTCIENNGDSYIYFGWNGATVNGVITNPDSTSVLRPHSRIYRDVIIPRSVLAENDIKEVKEISFSVSAKGENLSVPLYPITWMATDIGNVQ